MDKLIGAQKQLWADAPPDTTAPAAIKLLTVHFKTNPYNKAVPYNTYNNITNFAFI